jgi:hypothetical protein
MKRHPRKTSTKGVSTAFDVLVHEDCALKDLFAQIERNRGGSVEQHYQYGNLAKQLLRRLATRESSLVDVVAGISNVPALHQLAIRMTAQDSERRELFDQLENMSHGIQGIWLNTGQDFDKPLCELMDLLSPEIEWELSEALPFIRRSMTVGDTARLFGDANYVRHHAPLRLDPSGPRWYEHAPVVSRILTLIEHLRDAPRAARGHRGR